jgi:hypothetical protein
MPNSRYPILISDADRERFREIAVYWSAHDVLYNPQLLRLAYPHIVESVFRLKIVRSVDKEDVLSMIGECIGRLHENKGKIDLRNMDFARMRNYIVVAINNNLKTLIEKENNRKTLLYNYNISNGFAQGKDYIEQRIEKKIDGDLIMAIDKLLEKDSRFMSKQIENFWNVYKLDLQVNEICEILNITSNNYYQLHSRLLKRIIIKVFGGNMPK